MSNPKPHIIQPHERGHRPRLTTEEPTIIYAIKVPKSMADWCKKIGTNKVRDLIEHAMQQTEHGNNAYAPAIQPKPPRAAAVPPKPKKLKQKPKPKLKKGLSRLLDLPLAEKVKKKKAKPKRKPAILATYWPKIKFSPRQEIFLLEMIAEGGLKSYVPFSKKELKTAKSLYRKGVLEVAAKRDGCILKPIK